MSRFYKVSPRGFANEVVYIRCATKEQEAACERAYDGLEDRYPGAYCGWTSDRHALVPGVAINFEDRHYILSDILDS